MPVAYIPRACSLTAGRRALGCQANYICRRLNDLQTFACKSFAECRIMGLQAETECIGMDNTNGINAVDGHTDRKAMVRLQRATKGRGKLGVRGGKRTVGVAMDGRRSCWSTWK